MKFNNKNKIWKFNFFTKDEILSLKIKNKIIKSLNTLNIKYIIEPKKPEIVFIIGGDGTFLYSISKNKTYLDQIKFFFVKTGKLSIYSQFLPSEINNFLSDFFIKEKLKIEKFDLLEINYQKEKKYVLNEVKIFNFLNPINIDVSINDIFFQNFKGSGLSFSTMYGSTGFSRSIGGSVILEDNLFQLIEIAPINNNYIRTFNAPLILGKNTRINLKIKNKNAHLVFDNYKEEKVNQELSIEIKLSQTKVNLLTNYICTEKRINTLKENFFKK
jgi:NAD+ kinase